MNFISILRKVERKTRSPFVGLLIAIIGFGIFAQVLRTSAVDGKEPSPILEPDFPSAQELYPKALEKAQSWQSDAYLTWILFDFRTSGSLLSFAFSTPADPSAGLLINIWPQEDGYEIELRETGSPARTRNVPAIEREDWPIDSTVINHIAFEAKGLDFLTEHPEVDEILFQLRRLSGAAADATGLPIGQIVWRVDYYQLRGYSLDIYLDPKTGEIIGEWFSEPMWKTDPYLYPEYHSSSSQERIE
jgi:hypothetical protein